MFDVEDKIKWNDLAKSLQDIIMRKIGYDDLDKSLKDKLASSADSSILADVFASGMDGQVVKVNATKQILFPDDNYRKIKVVSTPEELADEMKRSYISLKDVFNTWHRFTQDTRYTPAKEYFWKYYMYAAPGDDVTYHDAAGTDYQNNAKDAGYKSAWTYNDLTKTIQNNGNFATLTGFVSMDKYYEYWINFTVKCNQAMWSGEDYCGIVIGWVQDDKGVEHTLSLVRGNNSIIKGGGPMDCVKFSLIYDMYQRTMQPIIDVTDQIKDAGKFCVNNSSGQVCNLYLAKHNGGIVAKTTNYADKDPGDNWVVTLEWNLPASKPSGWTDICWANVSKMLKEPVPMGLWALSYSSNFYIKGQEEIFDDDKIYALHTDEIYEYDAVNSKWVVTGKVHEQLPNRIFLSNPRLNSFYFYNYWNKYTRIK